MKRLAVLLGLAICTIAASTTLASTRSHAGTGPACTASPETAAASGVRPLVHPGEPLIESEPGVYMVAPRTVPETTTSPATARPASPVQAASPQDSPVVHPGEVLIESEPGVYIVPPRAVPETTTSPTTARAGGGLAVALCH